jgi:hypothetical protein
MQKRCGTNRHKIAYLLQYVNANKEYDELLDSLEYMRGRILGVPAQTMKETTQHSNASNRLEADIMKLEQLEDMIQLRRSRLLEIRINIENAIQGLQDGIQQRALHLRYIQGYYWERVCVEMNYSWRQMRRYHQRALAKIEIPAPKK